MPTTFSVAVFAHNEEQNIAATLRSILVAGEGESFEIVVLANGCRDNTVAVAQAHASQNTNIHLVEIELADKSNAWNYYVHQVSARYPFCEAGIHVFVDGDVQLKSTSFKAFSTTLLNCPFTNAVGALPTSGRDREAWSQRMVANGTLAGGLYALSADFLQRIRQHKVFIPRGLIGEDWAVSLFAKSNLSPLNVATHSDSSIVFALDAGFSFRSLSLWRLRDYKTYMRRLWRYSLRGVQYEMLVGLLLYGTPEELPEDVQQLYVLGVPPSRLKWVGATSFLRFIAVQKVRIWRTTLSRDQN